MPSTQVRDEVLREFPPIGKYRIRVVKRKSATVLDIREYVSSNTFEGFTRRGVVIAQKAEADLLRDILVEVIRDNLVK